MKCRNYEYMPALPLMNVSFQGGICGLTYQSPTPSRRVTSRGIFNT